MIANTDKYLYLQITGNTLNMKLINQGKNHHSLGGTVKAANSLFFIFLFLSFSAQADELADLNLKLNSKIITPSVLTEAIATGEERASVCKFCHGKDGNSTRKRIPNLAAQNPKYLLKQFELFASKQRKSIIMSELAKNLSNEDRINISLFYSNQKAKADPALTPELANKGDRAFQSRCSACHGKDGHGGELLPRLASQPAEYLNRTLNNYRDKPEFRPNSPMQAIVNSLNESEQKTVTAYISTME